MSSSLLVSVLILSAAFAYGVWVLISMRSRPLVGLDEAAWLTREELASFEERLSNCEEVVLLADQVEVPTRQHLSEFLRALIDNFAEGVRYRFVVPPVFFDKNERRITEGFHAIVTLAGTSEAASVDPAHLFRLLRRPYHSKDPDYPYLFYRYRDRTGGPAIVAFRGEDLGRGIASNYRRLEPELARTILGQTLPLLLELGEDEGRFAGIDFVEPGSPIDLNEVRKRKVTRR